MTDNIMKARPILFSTPMVQALLDGSKTMTRRILPTWQEPKTTDDGRWMAIANRHRRWGFGAFGDTEADCMKDLESLCSCPYGMKRNLLWVRETTEIDEDLSDSISASKYVAGGQPVLHTNCDDPEFNGSIAHWDYSRNTRPSIHMHKWASRITLEITNVCIERLNDISEDDAVSEGVAAVDVNGRTIYSGDFTSEMVWPEDYHDNAKSAFCDLWQSINGLGSWDQNPWVWVVKFKVHKVNVDDLMGYEPGNGIIEHE